MRKRDAHLCSVWLPPDPRRRHYLPQRSSNGGGEGRIEQEAAWMQRNLKWLCLNSYIIFFSPILLQRSPPHVQSLPIGFKLSPPPRLSLLLLLPLKKQWIPPPLSFNVACQNRRVREGLAAAEEEEEQEQEEEDGASQTAKDLLLFFFVAPPIRAFARADSSVWSLGCYGRGGKGGGKP